MWRRLAIIALTMKKSWTIRIAASAPPAYIQPFLVLIMLNVSSLSAGSERREAVGHATGARCVVCQLGSWGRVG